jgi:putative beta-barrel porin BBP2
MSRTFFMVSVLIVAALSPSVAFAQEDGGPDPETVRMRIGPLLLNPRMQLSNLGFDSNVFNEAADQNPKRDFTATITPGADVWIRLGRSWLQATIREDIVWFQKYVSERSANTAYTIDWRMRLNRLNVDVSPHYLSTRERPGFEIDARSQRTEYGGTALVETRMFAKTFVGLNASYQKVDYDKAAVFLNSNLQFELNRTVTAAGISVRHQLTPLTAITLSGGQSQDRFEFSPLRDSNSTSVSGSVSFDPHALIKGTATVGYRNFHPLTPGLPDYVGATATGNLTYTLLGATRFGVTFKRDLAYSYDINQPYYLETGVSGEIAQQIFGPLDVVGRAGTSTLAYRDRAGAAIVSANRYDYVHSYGGGIGYHFGRDLRVGFNVDQQHRISDLSERQYDGLRFGTAVTYAF